MQLQIMKIAIVASFFLAWVLTFSEQIQSESVLKDQISETMVNIRTGKSSRDRTDAAKHLFDITQGDASKRIDDQLLSKITGLLKDSDDSVLYWVARCLGNFGSRAKPAVPELLKILNEVDCIKASKSSASGIRFALKQMGVEAPASKCEM